MTKLLAVGDGHGTPVFASLLFGVGIVQECGTEAGRRACLVSLMCRCCPPGRTGAVAAPCKRAGAAPVPSPCQRPRSRAAGRGSNARGAPSYLTLTPAQAEVVFNKDKQGAPMEAMLKVLDGKLAGRTFLVGEAVSAADVALASHLLFFRVFMPQVRLPGPRLPRAPLQRAAPGCQGCGRSQSACASRQLQPEVHSLGVRACSLKLCAGRATCVTSGTALAGRAWNMHRWTWGTGRQLPHIPSAWASGPRAPRRLCAPPICTWRRRSRRGPAGSAGCNMPWNDLITGM
jgi:hypothetical protein